jgi:hypothetical protein
MRADRTTIASWLGGVAGAGGAGIAMLVCCATTAAAAGGGLAAAGGIVHSPWLITAGIIVAAMAIVAVILRRIGRAGAGQACYPPSLPDTDLTTTKGSASGQGMVRSDSPARSA